MRQISQLIEEISSVEVRFAKLVDVSEISTGSQLNRSELASSGEFPVLNGGISPSGFHSEFNTAENTIAISQGGASAGHVSFMTTKFWAGAHCYVVAPNVDMVLNKFLYYVLKNSQVKIQSSKMGAGIPGLSRASLYAVEVPVPSLQVQLEVIEILDNFTALELELEQELKARKKQYEHYRNRLLTFPEQGGVRWVPMGDIARIRNGSDWKGLPEGEIPVYGSGGVMARVGSAVGTGPSVLIPRKGSLGNLFYVDEPFWTVDTCFYTEIAEDSCIPKYLYYFLKTQDLAGMNLAGGVPSLTQTQLNKLQVPMPSLDEQGKIVAVLEKFDALVNDISSGLPAELNARRKQFEYYRDKLLTFKELKG